MEAALAAGTLPPGFAEEYAAERTRSFEVRGGLAVAYGRAVAAGDLPIDQDLYERP